MSKSEFSNTVFRKSLKKVIEAENATRQSPIAGTALTILHHYEVLVSAIKNHRDQRGDDRCYLDDLELYQFLDDTPDNMSDLLKLAPKEDHLESCARYWEQRQPESVKNSPCSKLKTIAQLEHTIHELRMEIAGLHQDKENLFLVNQTPETKLANIATAIDKSLKEAERLTGPIAFACGATNA